MSEIGKWVKSNREALGMTRKELGDAVGVSSEYIRILELGKRTPSNKVRVYLEVFLNREGNTTIPEPIVPAKSRGRGKGNKKVSAMIKLSELPVNTVIDVVDLEVNGIYYLWWIKDSDLFWTPIYAETMDMQEAAQISNDEVDWRITKYEVRSLPVGYSLPEAPTEFIEKRRNLAAFLLQMATGHFWDEAEGVDDFHENYMKDADEILRANPHLLGLETREKMGLI